MIFEAIRRQGNEELRRPTSSLALSGLIAGLTLGLSVFAQALLRAHLPDEPWRDLVAAFGYSIGFIIVSYGKMQLFTENTITAVCPVIEQPDRAMVYRLARLWTLVFLCNVAGAALFSVGFNIGGVMAPEVKASFMELSASAMSHGWISVLLRGVGAGWMIATLVWILPNTHDGKLLAIVLITWLIAVADFSHVVAGTAEMVMLAIEGEMSLWRGIAFFLVPALVGNVIGSTVLFTVLAWGQIRAELPGGDEDG